jgi:hypothetical protein
MATATATRWAINYKSGSDPESSRTASIFGRRSNGDTAWAQHVFPTTSFELGRPGFPVQRVIVDCVYMIGFPIAAGPNSTLSFSGQAL